MARQLPSTADRHLIDSATARGVALSGRQVAQLREYGLIPSPADSPEVVDFVVELERRKRGSQPRHELVLWMFLDGHDVPEASVRAGYRLTLESFQRSLGRLADTIGSSDVLDLAEALARKAERSKTGRTVLRLRQSMNERYQHRPHREVDPATGESVHVGGPAFRFGVWFNTLIAILDPDRANLDDVADVFMSDGLAGSLRDIGAHTPDTEKLREQLRDFTPDRLRHSARIMPFEVLRGAADDTRRLMDRFGVPREECPAVGWLLLPLLIAVSAQTISSLFEIVDDRVVPRTLHIGAASIGI